MYVPSVEKGTRAATTIQAHWRGYQTRKELIQRLENPFYGLDPNLLQRLNKSAVKIQVGKS